MRFLADESFELRLVVFLRSLGHDATVIGLDYPPSLPDRDVLAIAFLERRVLITNFAEHDSAYEKAKTRTGKRTSR